MRLERNSAGLDEDMRGIEQGHGKIGQSERARDKSEMDSRPTPGLRQRALPLYDQRTGERHQIEERARLIDQRTHQHQAQRDSPLGDGASESGTQAQNQ